MGVITYFYKATLFYLDCLIGVPFTTPGDINRKVQEEHMRYLVAELDIRVILS